MPPVALATCAALPNLTDDDRLLIPALAARGIGAVPAVWDDDTVDWRAFAAVVIRSHMGLPPPATALSRVDRSPRGARCSADQPGARAAVERREDVSSRSSGCGCLRCADALGRARRHGSPVRDTSRDGLVARRRQAVDSRDRVPHLVDRRHISRRRRGAFPGARRRRSGAGAAVHRGDHGRRRMVADVLRGRVRVFRSEDAQGRRLPRAERFWWRSRGATTPVPRWSRRPRASSRRRRSARSELTYARVDGCVVEGTFALMELEVLEPGLFLAVGPRGADDFADAHRPCACGSAVMTM